METGSKITLNLSRAGATALTELKEQTGDSMTTLVNDALVLYSLLKRKVAQGPLVLLHEGEKTEIHFL